MSNIPIAPECPRCGFGMVVMGFGIYKCTNCGLEEKQEDVA